LLGAHQPADLVVARLLALRTIQGCRLLLFALVVKLFFVHRRQFDYCIMEPDDMARKRKPQRFSAVAAVKAAARENIGAPPATRRAPDKKRVPQQKHKPTLARLLREAE